jgi:hypothetical protein
MKKDMFKQELIKSPSIFCMMLLFVIELLYCDVAFTQSEFTLIKVGRFWTSATDRGNTQSVSFTGGWFPADFNTIGNNMRRNECITGGSIWLASSNYTHEGNVVPYAMFVPVPPSQPDGMIVDPLSTATRYGYKLSVVDFEDVTLDWYNDIDPSMMVGNSDQTVTYSTRYQNGVELKRTILAFSNQNHDDYILTELEFTHKGDQTLTDFVMFMKQQETGIERANGRNPDPKDDEEWKSQTEWFHYYGARPGDSLRIFYQYMADDPLVTGDMMGGPVISQEGRLIESGFFWWTFLHASGQPYVGDKSVSVDDPLQPKVSFTMTDQLLPIEGPTDEPDKNPSNKWKPLLEGEFFTDELMPGAYAGTFHRRNSDELGDPDYTAIGIGHGHDGNFPGRYVIFGPYTFEPGQSLHIVYASGESGIGIEKMKEVGNKWYHGTLGDPPGIPDARTGYFPSNFAFPADATENDKKKDRWISTGIDSMHKAVSAAKWNYERDYMVPMSPPPPATTITGYGGYVEIKWSDPEAEALENFAGYRIMRRISNLDTVFFESIHTTDASDMAQEHIFQDSTVLPGASYYYYVQSAVRVAENDPNALPQNRGKLVYSGRVYNPTTHWIDPPRFSQDDLSKIRMAPNPYNINDPAIETYGWTDRRGILFFNLPAKVTIKICTEFGDLVQTIEHDSSVLAGSLRWDMLTSSEQVIASGVYIVIFEKPDGEVAFQKLVVVR